MNIHNFIKTYKSKLIELIKNIDIDVIESIIQSIELTVVNKSRIYILGNGGSSATASHMVNDLGAGLRRRGIINLDVVSLADNTPVVTAIANDIGYENIFYMQLEGLLKSEDLVIAISCSGNSPNIIKAAKYAKSQGSKLVGITGFDGGILKELSDINFHVDADRGQYGLVEDVHMILDHIIYSYYSSKIAL
jgi:D-sedoheptulose 7-phosphate isomerase